MPHRVLIVDDEYPVQLLLKTMMESAGLDWRVAESFDEAELDARWADVALVDHHLGDRSGIDLVGRLRELHPAIRIVMVTGDDTVRERAIAAGADAFLTKPFVLDEVLAAIDDVEDLFGVGPGPDVEIDLTHHGRVTWFASS